MRTSRVSSKDLKNCIIRILKDDELSGYSIYKMLTLKGKETWPNHVYTLLVQMEKKEGWLKSRWRYDTKDTRLKKASLLAERIWQKRV